jgi:hypothetical protein
MDYTKIGILKRQDFILLIMNCQQYIYKAEKQKTTWLNNLTPSSLIYYHVIGYSREQMKTDNDFEFDNENHVLRLCVEDDYNSLPKKVIKAYDAVYQTFDFKYIFKTDDDQNLLKSNWFEIISRIVLARVPKVHYGGKFIHVEKPYLSQYHRIHPELPKNLPIYQTNYCNGRFYFLSNQAIQNLLSKQEEINKEYLEDYAIGLHLDQYFKINALTINTDLYFEDMK